MKWRRLVVHLRLGRLMPPHFGRQAMEPRVVNGCRAISNVLLETSGRSPGAALELDVRPWQQKITALARKSQPNGLILLIQPWGLHAAALCFPAREDEWKRERKTWGAGHSSGQLDWTGLRDPEGWKRKQQLRIILDIRLYSGLWCVWTVGNHTKWPGVVFFEWLWTLQENYNQSGQMVTYSGYAPLRT